MAEEIKVLLVNGSPHHHGCTDRALDEVAAALEESGVTADRFWVETKPLTGCIACGKCFGVGRCVFNDRVNEFLDIAADYDGFVFGSPVHYAAMGGTVKCFMDRAFYAGSSAKPQPFKHKPAACVVSARRAGTTVTYDEMNKYFGINQMPIVSSFYWNMVHGSKPEDVEQDLEGLQAMRVLGRNMAYVLKCQKAGAAAGILPPKGEPVTRTNFIR